MALLASLLSIVAAPSAHAAAGTVLFQNAFNDRTVDGTGSVTVPTPVSGTNVACLTALGNSSTPPLHSCSGTFDLQGSGKLRLTSTTGSQVGGVFGLDSFPTSNGLDVTFNSYQWGGTSADGIAFILAAVDPTNPVAPTSIASSGGALGYSATTGLNGLADAYLGAGLDVYGNFSNSSFQGTGCPSTANFGAAAAGTVAVRGPGNNRVGYCGLATTYDGTSASKLTLHATTRSASVVPVEVLINPTTSPFTSGSGITVSAGTFKIVVTPVGQSTKTLSASLPSVSAGLYPSSTWLNANGVPKQLAFGFVGSTGSVTDNHEISDVKVVTFNPVPQLAISATSYSASTSGPGDPVTYQLAPSVLSGANESGPISVTQTVPAGVKPLGAYGTGWVCQPPSGQTITCTTSASSFTNGTSLPAVTVVATVTGSSVASTTIQTSSTSAVSSADGTPATDTVMTAGTRPSAPTSVAISPTSGLVAGGYLTSVSASTTATPTAIEIGTTAELQAGTGVLLLPCASGRAAGCFNIEGSTYVIQSMPARATSGDVSVALATLGIAGTTTFTYLDKPATPAAPTAAAGITSATVSWTAPATNGSPITSYVVTPYLAGVAQTARSFDASVTTRTLTGLTAGSSYTFTVAAVNAVGTSTSSAQSTAVVPYTVPGAPAITAVSAGDSRVTLTWTAPANDGSSPITGYVVTPYIGATAQTPQTFLGTTTTRTVTGLTAGAPYTFTVAAQNLAGTGAASAPSTSVTPNVSPGLTFSAPPAGEVGVAYSRQLTVDNGTAPFAWSISSGSLPAGLTLNASTGLLSGTPTAAGSFPITVQVVDASGNSATRTATLVVAAAPALTFSPAPGEVGVAYSQQPAITGGTAPISWAITAGSLPAGVALNTATGLISGTPTATGNFSFTVTATDGFGQTASKTTSVSVVSRPSFTSASPPAGQVGVAYTASLAATGGTAPLSWSITAGSLPSGVALDPATGALSGTPTIVGDSSFTVSVSDANGQGDSKTVTLSIAPGPLVIVKTANVSSAPAGSDVAYTITVTNTGPTAFTGVGLSDPLTGVLDDATYNGNAVATSGTVSYAASVLGWTGTVAAHATVTISYTVRLNNPDVGNKVLSNTVTSTTLGTNCAAGSHDAQCSSTVTVPGLSIVKSADVPTTTPGSTVHFTVVVTNSGQSAYPAATLTDDLAGVLDDGGYNNDAAATSGSLSYTRPSLTWTGALGVGASVTITYSATVGDPDLGDRSVGGTVVSTSAGSPCAGGNPAASCTATVSVLVPALAITNTADVATITPGGTVTYTVTVANTGQTPYPTGTTVSLSLQDALGDGTYQSATASAGSVAFNASTGTLVWTGGLAVGATVTVTASVRIQDPDAGDKNLATIATSSAQGSSCPVGTSNPACGTTVQVRVPALMITTSADVTTTTPGANVPYTVSATNTGQTDYTGATFAVALAGVLDDATYNGDVSSNVGRVSIAGSTLTWTGDLPIGATVRVTFSVAIHDPDAGDRTAAVSVTSTTAGSNCPVGGHDPLCTGSVAVLVPALSIIGAVDRATTTPGSTITYSVAVKNTGETTYTGLAVTADLTGALDDAVYNNDASISTGSLVTRPDGTAAWVLNLAPGDSATALLTMTVDDPDAGDHLVTVGAVSDAVGSSCPSGSSDPDCRRTATVLVPGLRITKSTDSSTAGPGDTVDYTIRVQNIGETSYPAATITDDLSTALDDATYGGDATATRGTVSYSSPTLTWTGSLDPGDSAVLTYSVQVRDPDPGDKLIADPVTSSVQGNNCPVSGPAAVCTSPVTILVPRLTITNTAAKQSATPGATVGYTVQVTNSGATPFTNAAIADSLSGVLDDATYNGDVTATRGTASFNASTISWTGDLPIGAAATITFSVTVHDTDGGNNRLTSTITSTVQGNNCPSGSTDPQCSNTVPVARLVISQSYADPSTTPGSLVTLSATFTNTGQVPYNGISISSPSADTVDDAIPSGDEVASSGTLVLTSSAIVWTGDIPVGHTITVTGTLTVTSPDTGNKILTGTLVTAAAGSNCPAGGSDSRCTAILPVLVPELTITKSADRTLAVPGTRVAYTITAHNTGQTPYTAASLNDPLAGVLDDATYDGDAATTTGAVAYAGSTLTWTGDLAVGATAVITYSVTVAATQADKTMVDTVSSAAIGSTCPPSGGPAACSSTVVVLTPALTIVNTADAANATLGSTVIYSVKVTDSGQTPYPVAAFTDSLDRVLDDATVDADSVTATSGTASLTAGVLTWTGTLVPGGSATISYTAQINNPATGDGTMANTVTSSTAGNICASGSTDPRCTATVAVTNSVTLTFTKTTDVASAVAGGNVSHTVTIANSSDVAVAAANFSDPLDGILDDASYNADAAATSGDVSFADSTLSWVGTVPAHGTVTVTYSVTVHSTTTGDQILADTISSTSVPSSDNCVADSGDPRCTSTVTVSGLVIRQSYTEASTTPGALVHLSATFTNTGQTPYTGITVASPTSDTLDDATPTGDQRASSGTLALTASAITWTGSIPVGGTVTVTGTLTVHNPDTGNRLLTGTLTTTAQGSNCPAAGADARCTASLAVLIPGLTITKTADMSFAVPGRSVHYTVTVQNTGETAYSAASVADSLAGVLDDATYGQDAVATTGTVSYADATLTWTGDLAVGATATITYSVTASSPDTGDKTMVDGVSSTTVGSTCPPATGNPACRSVIAVLTPALSITSSANAANALPGDTVRYTVVATNTGQVPYATAGVSVPLGDVLDDATMTTAPSATSGTATIANDVLSWTGALGLRGAVTISYTVTIDDPVTGNHRLDQTATSADQGSTCTPAQPAAACSTTVPIAGLQIVNTAEAITKPTSVVHYSATLTNSGDVPYVGITVTDLFAAALDDGTYNGDAAATAGSLIIVPGSGQVIWTGDIAVGAAVTITGSLTVNNPDLGDRTMTTSITTDAAASTCPVGGTNPDCATRTTVQTPSLVIVKSSDATTATPGSTVGYTITVTNSGEVAYVGATIHDSLVGSLDDGTYAGDGFASSGDLTFTSPVLNWTGDLAVGQSVVITYDIHIDDPDLGDHAMVNAVVSDELGSTCPTSNPQASCTTFVRVLEPKLDLAVAADTGSTTPGSTVGYTITVRNSGETTYTGASVSADLSGLLDDARYADDATSTAGVTSFDATTLTWIGDLNVGDTATIAFHVQVSDPDPGDKDISVALRSTVPGSSCNGRCSSDVAVLVPGLEISTSADAATATPGERVQYTATISNTGQTPYTGTIAAISLTDVLDDATFDGTVDASIGVATYTQPGISWAGTLPVGDIATITFAVTVRDPEPGNKQMTATVVAPVPGSSCPTGDTGAGCTASVSVLIPSLTIGVTTNGSTTTPGSVVPYTLVISNTGETSYDGARVVDSLNGVFPDATYNGDAVAVGGGTLDYTAPVLTWTGDLAVGASVTVTYSITVLDPDPGDKFLVTSVTSVDAGSSCQPHGTQAGCTTDVRVLVPGLRITQVADQTAIVAGSPLHYTLTVTNTGETAYLPAVVSDPLGGVLDDATYAQDASSTEGTVEFTDGVLVWTGALEIGASATITFSVTGNYPATGDGTLTNTVDSTSPGSTCRPDSAAECSTSIPVLVPALRISKTVDTTVVVAGGTVQYTITAVNTGAADYPAATISDSLANVLDDGSYNNDATATGGALDYSDGTLSWAGPIAQGATVVITYSVTTDRDDAGDASLDNRVVSTAIGSNCPADSADGQCATATAVAGREITLSGLTPSFTLTGLPDSTVRADDAVRMTVTTNSPGGYVVTVQAETDALTAATPGNAATIPIGDLQVRPDNASQFQRLSPDAPVVVGRRDDPSAPGGDAISNDVQVQVPSVPSDTYSTTLDYIATTQ